MEKIDLSKIGKPRATNKDGIGWAVEDFKILAEKINEIIDFLNFVEQKNGNTSNMAEFNQLKSSSSHYKS